VKVLIGCEESQVVCKAFRARGFSAFSCDLEPTRGNPDWHFQADIMAILPAMPWDLIILHPPCTALSLSGNRWYGTGMPREDQRFLSIAWTLAVWDLAKKHSHHVALENPASVIFKYLDAPVQYIQPWQFGHGEQKKTGFALHNLPPLKPTKIVSGREQKVWKMGPSPTRQRDRSVTYPGIAAAMADQWGNTVRQSPGSDSLK
jgi:hypothetical protein